MSVLTPDERRMPCHQPLSSRWETVDDFGDREARLSLLTASFRQLRGKRLLEKKRDVGCESLEIRTDRVAHTMSGQPPPRLPVTSRGGSGSGVEPAMTQADGFLSSALRQLLSEHRSRSSSGNNNGGRPRHQVGGFGGGGRASGAAGATTAAAGDSAREGAVVGSTMEIALQLAPKCVGVDTLTPQRKHTLFSQLFILLHHPSPHLPAPNSPQLPLLSLLSLAGIHISSVRAVRWGPLLGAPPRMGSGGTRQREPPLEEEASEEEEEEEEEELEGEEEEEEEEEEEHLTWTRRWITSSPRTAAATSRRRCAEAPPRPTRDL
jgi:hypothetical protein